MSNSILLAIVAILTASGFIASLLRLFGNEKNSSLTMDLVLLFLGLSLTLWQLSYFSILIASLGALGILLETKK